MPSEMPLLTLHLRPVLGKKVKRERKNGWLPVVVYGAHFPSTPFSVRIPEAETFLKEHPGETLTELRLPQGTTTRSLLREVARHPVSGRPLHLSFLTVSEKEKIRAQVPVKTEGESPVVKNGEGMVLHLKTSVEVECYPSDLPSHLSVDLSSLAQINQGVTVNDLDFDPARLRLLSRPEEMVLKIVKKGVEAQEAPSSPPTPEMPAVLKEKKEAETSSEAPGAAAQA